MLTSGKEKQRLCGWLIKNGNPEYLSPLKLQYFLFFYEAFSKIHNERANFSDLSGCANGPVFSKVFEDYMYRRSKFEAASQLEYILDEEKVNEERAKCAWFAVYVSSESELAIFFHKMNIWKSQAENIKCGCCPVPLSADDFDEGDAQMMQKLEDLFPMSLIENSCAYKINNFTFLFNKEDAANILIQHFDALCEMCSNEELHNPVYVRINNEEGKMYVN